MSCDVLGVFAHPDDESLLAGGTLAACAAAGLRVGIVSMTHGELGGFPGATRARELSAAGAALGADWAVCLDFPDGELGSCDRACAAAALRELAAAAAQPDGRSGGAVLTFSAEGLYWHPDHIAVHEIVRASFPAERICELSWPAGLLAGVVDELRARELPTDVWGLDPRAFGVPAERIARELDVSAFLDVKLRALRCHPSQFPSGHALADLPDDLARRLLGHEWLVRCPPGDWLADAVASGCAARSGA